MIHQLREKCQTHKNSNSGCMRITDQIAFYEIITTENTGQEVIRIANHMANTQLPAHCFLEKSNLSLNFVTLPGQNLAELWIDLNQILLPLW